MLVSLLNIGGKNCVLVGCYAASSDNSLPTFRCITTHITVLIYIVAEATNHALAGNFPLITDSRLDANSKVSQHKAMVQVVQRLKAKNTIQASSLRV